MEPRCITDIQSAVQHNVNQRMCGTTRPETPLRWYKFRLHNMVFFYIIIYIFIIINKTINSIQFIINKYHCMQILAALNTIELKLFWVLASVVGWTPAKVEFSLLWNRMIWPRRQICIDWKAVSIISTCGRWLQLLSIYLSINHLGVWIMAGLWSLMVLVRSSG